MPDYRFRTEFRLRKGCDFQQVYQRRCTASDNVLLVFGGVNGLPFPRLGLSVSRKVGNAVVRNRWKRLMREAFRLTRDQLPTGVDLVLIPRSPSPPELAALLESLPRLAGRVARKLAASAAKGPAP